MDIRIRMTAQTSGARYFIAAPDSAGQWWRADAHDGWGHRRL